MKTNILSLLVVLLISVSSFSQSNLNEYKYIIVPEQFSFLKEPNQYRINGLAEFLFNKYNFSAYMEGTDYPKDYYDDRCSALRADVIKEPGMFKSKLKVVLKNCNDQVVYTSPAGESREKDYSKAYNEALRRAFKAFEVMDYKYEPSGKREVSVSKKESDTQNVEVANEIEKLKEEIQSLKQQKKEPVVVNEVEELQVVPKATVVKVSEVSKNEFSSAKETTVKVVSSILYAQEIQGGYQLVDSTPKVIYKIKKTGLSNVFLVQGESSIVYKKDNDWVVEFYEGDKLKKEILKIKF